MKERDPGERPDLMGGPDGPADVMEGGEEPPGEEPDLMAPGSPEREDAAEEDRDR